MSTTNPVFLGLGRRKTSVARVRLKSGAGAFQVNDKPIEQYFPTLEMRNRAQHPLILTATQANYDVSVNVNGGGTIGQAEAILLGVARALKDANPVLFDQLRLAGLMTRDSRQKERKKFGRKGARRGFQFSKR